MAFDETQRELLLQTVERFARDRIAPRAAEIDRTAEFPHDVYRGLAELGLFSLWLPEEYGGVAADLRTIMLVEERLARVLGIAGLFVANCGDGATPILLGGSEELRQRYLPAIAAGELIPSICMTEAAAGSDAAAMRTLAVRSGDEYTISGRKMFITNGSVAGVFVVFATVDPERGAKGVTAFAIPRETPGLSIGRDEDLLGFRGSPASEVNLDNVVVPAAWRLGEEGEGFKIAMTAMDDGRLSTAALSLGVASGAVAAAIEHARSRVAFGKPVIEHQGLMFLLAELATEIAAGWTLLLKATEMIEHERTRQASTYASMAKLFCTGVAMRATTEAITVFGGVGVTRDFPVGRMMRDAKVFQVVEGTDQIQKLIIGRYLQKSGLPLDLN
ncbi:MAG: acyl-CoA dehydrogenase [Chloroflexota bacterium]|jgi:alkylation response protein AidB-like acyl-CoA dehydrogenase|nr:acyl-CoA dehydrogenase [Chloroflexota bacterium]